MIGRKLKIFAISLMVLVCSITASSYAQDTVPSNDDIFSALQTNHNTEGEIILYQDASINVLIDRHKRINEKGLDGYRIQIYRGSGQKAREDANDASQLFRQNFPTFNTDQVYPIYESPYFKLRVGDYRTKNEAFELLHQIKKIFPHAYIVATSINFPKLESNHTSELSKTDE